MAHDKVPFREEPFRVVQLESGTAPVTASIALRKLVESGLGFSIWLMVRNVWVNQPLEVDGTRVPLVIEFLHDGFVLLQIPESGDGGNRTRVRDRVKGSFYKRSRRLNLAFRRPRRRARPEGQPP